MKNKLFSVLFALFYGLFITYIAWAAPPFEVPAKGGLPQCKADLEVCETDLSTCGGDLTDCTMDLGICASDLGLCIENFDTCSEDLSSCASDLSNCNAEFETCDNDLITCTQNLDQSSENLSICETDLLVCQENAVVFPATGQTLCWTQAGVPIECDVEKGEDGYFEAGGTLSYIWNNDGTLVDVNTKLMWERKDMSGGIHDMNRTYRWVQSFREHIHVLNNTCKNDETVSCGVNGDADCAAELGEGEVCGFAGFRDWRMPNVKEMQSIIDYSQTMPAVSLAFNWMCGEGCSLMGESGCSCTSLGNYWTSTSHVGNPERAWFADREGQIRFIEMIGSDVHKYNELRVRAVRGGL